MNVFEIKYIRSKNEYVVNVFAPDAETACADARRYIKAKSYYDDAEIVEVSRIAVVQVFYKTPKRKSK